MTFHAPEPAAAKTSVLLLVLLMFVAPACSRKPKTPPTPLEKIPINEAMVIIDGHEISGAWLRNWCVTQYVQVMRAGGGMPMTIDEYSLIEGGMDLLGKMYVLALEAQKRGLTVGADEIQARLSKEAARFESTSDWQNRLEKSGLTVEQRKEELRIELLFEKYQEQVVAPEVRARFATDDTARDYYDKHVDLFKQPRQVHLLHITRAVAADATEESKRKEKEATEKARARIAGGETFESVAREVSTESTALKGGDVGWVSIDAPIHADLKTAVLAMKPGDLSPVLETPQGYHLFKAVEVKEAGIRTFEESKEEIKKRIFQQAIKLEMEKRAAQLKQQLVAEKKYKIRDLNALLGPRPAPPPATPPAQGAPAPPAQGAPAPPAQGAPAT